MQETGSRGIVHRDVKPSNIMITSTGELYLTDFGFLQTQEKELGGSTIAGTIGYMAPEQLWGRATPQSDIFGLGATMAYLLTNGKEPHEMELADNLTPKIRQQLQSKIEEGLIKINLVEICERAMHPLPEGRYKNAGELIEALERCQRGLPKEEELIRLKVKEWGKNYDKKIKITGEDSVLNVLFEPLAPVFAGFAGSYVGINYLSGGWTGGEVILGYLFGGAMVICHSVAYNYADPLPQILYHRHTKSKKETPRQLFELQDFPHINFWNKWPKKTRINSAVRVDDINEMYLIASEKLFYNLSTERKEDRLIHYLSSQFGIIVVEEKEGNFEVLAKKMHQEKEYEHMKLKLEEFVSLINERKQKYHVPKQFPTTEMQGLLVEAKADEGKE